MGRSSATPSPRRRATHTRTPSTGRGTPTGRRVLLTSVGHVFVTIRNRVQAQQSGAVLRRLLPWCKVCSRRCAELVGYTPYESWGEVKMCGDCRDRVHDFITRERKMLGRGPVIAGGSFEAECDHAAISAGRPYPMLHPSAYTTPNGTVHCRHCRAIIDPQPEAGYVGSHGPQGDRLNIPEREGKVCARCGLLMTSDGRCLSPPIAGGSADAEDGWSITAVREAAQRMAGRHPGSDVAICRACRAEAIFVGSEKRKVKGWVSSHGPCPRRIAGGTA